MKLEGLRVLDLSAFLPGPHMTMTMADHGADVLMIERADGAGEPARALGERASDGVSVWFRNIARGKRSLALDLKTDEGRERLLSLAEEADVFVEAFRPGVADRLGVGYDAVSARNPRVVYCSISAFGQSGGYVHRPAHDLAVQALAGLVDLGRARGDGRPALPNMPVADLAASLTALSAILMALLRRATTGRGDHVDIAMYDCALAFTPNVTGEVFAHGAPPPVQRMRSFGGAAMYNLYDTADDGCVAIGGVEQKFAVALFDALGRPELAQVASLPPGPAQEPARTFLRETFRARDLAHWVAFLDGVDCCWAPVRTLLDAFDDSHAAARGLSVTDAQGQRHIGPAIRFKDEPAQPGWAVPPYVGDGSHPSAGPV